MAGPLAGVTILDLTQQLAGPGGTMLLGDMGATIIRVEPPPEPPVPGMPVNPDGTDRMRVSLNIGRSKRSISVDLEKPEGREIVYAIARRSEVVAQNYRPGVAEKLKMDRETFRKVNPDLIYSTVSAYGELGPHRHRLGFDIIAQGGGGSMVVDRRNERLPAPETVPIADVTGFLLEALGIVAALYHKKATGRPQAVSTSMMAGVVLQNILRLVSVERDDREWRAATLEGVRQMVAQGVPYGDVLDTTATGIGGQPIVGAGGAAMALILSVYYRTYHTKDSYIAIGCLNARQQRRFNQALELGDPRFEPGATLQSIMTPESIGRFKNLPADAEAKFLTKTTDEWLAYLDEREVACGPILNVLEIFDSEQHRLNQMIVDHEDPWSGPVRVLGFPILFEETPMAIGNSAPTLGQHTDEILTWAGYGPDDIRRLRDQNVVF
ncbi:MAG: CoA transferase [Chloroflexi bacterium]|nr:CoA transferase [Chloroflexota bacterium]